MVVSCSCVGATCMHPDAGAPNVTGTNSYSIWKTCIDIGHNFVVHERQFQVVLFLYSLYRSFSSTCSCLHCSTELIFWPSAETNCEATEAYGEQLQYTVVCRIFIAIKLVKLSVIYEDDLCCLSTDTLLGKVGSQRPCASVHAIHQPIYPPCQYHGYAKNILLL